MKEILKIMRFDYLTAKPLAEKASLLAILIITALCLFLTPIAGAYVMFIPMVFVIPLQNTAEKSGFHKLYGILPVQRKNITRARFLYMFLMHFIGEIIGMLMVVLAIVLKLYRFLPNQSSELMQIAQEEFTFEHFMPFGACVGMFAVACTGFSYMELMGQVFGRENEMKIMMLTIGAFLLLAFAFVILNDHDLLPMINLNREISLSGKILISVLINFAVLGLCILFGEITVKKLSQREL